MRDRRRPLPSDLSRPSSAPVTATYAYRLATVSKASLGSKYPVVAYA